jgi:hypothetical protein
MTSVALRASLFLTVLIALASCAANTPEAPSAPVNPPSVASGGPVTPDALTTESIATPLSWTAGPSLPAARAQAASVTLADGSILLLGGSSATAPTSVLKLAPAANVWAIVGTLDHIRVAPGAGLYSNGLIAVYGGADKKVDKSSTGYDPIANRTSSLPSMGTPRTQHAFASAFGLAYAVGGRDDLGNALASVEYFAGGKWVPQASLPEPRVGAGASSLGLDLLVFGGSNAAGTVSSTVYRLSGGVWTTLAPMPVAVQNAAVVAGRNNLIYVLGGSGSAGPVSTVQVYNTLSNTWSREVSLPVALSGASAAIDSAGRIVVIGGSNAAKANLATVWLSPQSGAAPIFTSTPGTVITVNQAYSYQLTASGKPAPTFSLVTGPAGMSVNTSSGLVSWTPTVAQFGTQKVTLRASSIEGTALQTFSISVLAPPPSIPTGLVATNITETSLTLSWSPSIALIGTVSYLVSERGFCSGRGGCSFPAVAQVSATTLKITGLVAGSSHIYFVTALTSAGSTSVKSAGLSVVALQPAPPTNLTVTKVTQVSVSLSWTASVGPVPIVGYRVYDIDLTTGLTILRVDAITGTSATVINLGSNTRHLLRVVAYDAGFNLSPVLAGNQVDVTTNSLPSIFHPPAFINPVGLGAFPEQIVGVVGQPLMVVSAAAHMTAGQNYVLGTGGLPKPTLSVLSGPAGMVIDNLTGVVSWNPVNALPGNYIATIRASNVEGSTNFVFNYTVYPAGTDLLSPTGILSSSITNITRNSALVTWSAATDNKAVAGYNILAQTTGLRSAPTGPLIKVGTTTGTNFTITTLTPATAYAIYVQAFDAAGNTGATGPSYISTLP